MRQPRILLAVIALVIIFIYSLHSGILGKTVYGDGIFYYAWVRSLVVDKNIHFANEFRHFGVQTLKTSQGKQGNKYAIGPALLWYPSFQAIHLMIKGDGYTFPYQYGIGLTSVLYALTGLTLLYFVLAKKYGSNVACMATLSIFLSTQLLYYGAIDTVNSHALSFFMACVLVSFLLYNKPHLFAAGISVGLLAAIRPQDGLYLLLVLPFIRKKNILSFLLGLFVGFSPQLIAWRMLYGFFLFNAYGQGGEHFSFAWSHIIDVLFHKANGLFLWTPITAIGFLGLLIPHQKFMLNRFMGVLCILSIIIIASWSSWLEGASYSSRMFVSMLPLIAFGLSEIYYKIRSFRFGTQIIWLCVAIPFALLNVLFQLYFLVTHT